METDVRLFSGSVTQTLSEQIAKSYGKDLGNISHYRFSDGEIQVSYEESIRGQSVFVIQSTMPPADNLMELLLMLDAAKRASAKEVIAVLPYFGYARQDRKDQPRVAIGAVLTALYLLLSIPLI